MTFRFHSIHVEPFNGGQDYGFALEFRNEEGNQCRHATRIPVGESFNETMERFKTYIEFFQEWRAKCE